jgi:hypothetical protein
VPDPFAVPQRLVVSPPLDAAERALVGRLVLWPGRPRGRSPWRLCDDGCCLDLAPGASPAVAADWLRFWLRELLSPRAAEARERAASAGLGRHRVDGRVLVDASSPVLLRVTDSRLREVRLDDELFPVEERPRPDPAPVVELRGQRTER